MAQMLTDKDFADVKRDIDDIGDSVNEKKIIYPRYGAPYRSIPLVTEDIENTINEWDAAVNTITQEGGIPDLAVSTWSGRTQQAENKDFVTSVGDYTELSTLEAGDGRTAYVKKDSISGEFVFSSSESRTVDGGVIVQGVGGSWVRKFSGDPSILWFEPVADGVADDSVKFASASQYTGSVYVPSGTYKTSIHIGCKFYGTGLIKAIIDSNIYDYKCSSVPQLISTNVLTYDDGFKELNTVLAIGDGSFPNADNSDSMTVAFGGKTLSSATKATRITAVGAHALRRVNEPFSVVAVGDSAMENSKYGSRLVAVGSNALQFVGCDDPTTYKHEFMIAADQYGLGVRNSNWRNIVGAMGTPKDLPTSAEQAKESVAIGRNAMLHNIRSANDVAIGYNAMVHGWNTAYNVAVGNSALRDATETITTVAVGSQSAELLQQGAANTVVGHQAFQSAVHLESCTAIGTQALQKLSGNSTDPTTARNEARQNTAVGAYAMQNTINAVNMVAVGNASFQNASGSQSVAVGVQAGSTLNTAINTTLIGYMAGTKTPDGSPTVTLTNSAALGYDAALSGDNQVQLGNSDTTTYVYGTVQNRSDARDKADIRDTELGLDFINSLRPVDYKWDMREDYIETLEDGTVIKHDKDGSKKRTRYHHGFIAQEVPDGFGGYQDHKVQGGADVLSLGYDEFIAPLVRAVQELSQRVAELEAEKQK